MEYEKIIALLDKMITGYEEMTKKLEACLKVLKLIKKYQRKIYITRKKTKKY